MASSAQEEVSEAQPVQQCIAYIGEVNPELVSIMLQQYFDNPRSLRQFAKLMAQPIPPN